LPLADPVIRALRDDDGLAALSLGSDEFRPLKSFLRSQRVMFLLLHRRNQETK
jgi:hypothetical protein